MDVLGENFPIYTKRVFTTSEQDLVKKIGVKVGSKTEFKYLQIELIGVDDIEGEDNCPGVALTYRFHLFVGFIDSRPSGSTFDNSTDEFNTLLLNLRNEFSLNDKVFDPDDESTSNNALERQDFIVVDDDPLTGVTGHFIDQITIIEAF